MTNFHHLIALAFFFFSSFVSLFFFFSILAFISSLISFSCSSSVLKCFAKPKPFNSFNTPKEVKIPAKKEETVVTDAKAEKKAPAKKAASAKKEAPAKKATATKTTAKKTTTTKAKGE